MTTNSCRNSSPAGTARVGLPSRSRPTLAPPLNQFQAAERGGPFGSSAFFTPIFSAARRAGYGAHHVQPSGLSQVSARRFLLALSLVQSPQKSSSGSAQVFHQSPLSSVGYVPNVGERACSSPTEEVSKSTQNMAGS